MDTRGWCRVALALLWGGLLACNWMPGQVTAVGPSFASVGDIKDAMYNDQKYFGGCYKLLNSSAAVGCAAPSSARVTAMLAKLEDLPEELSEDRAVLVGTTAADTYISRLQQNPGLLRHVKIVLVYDSGLPANSSVAGPFPGGAEYAPYSNSSAPSSYIWNPFGSSIASGYLPIPVFQLAAPLASDALWRAEYNAQNDFKGAAHWVDTELTMEATQPNSITCLSAGTCWPLGGFNVWAAMPPLPTNATSGLPQASGLPVTLVVAQIDSNSFFHDSTQGADAPLSGLLVLLAAMKLLADSNQTTTYTRQLVFMAVAGEPWGYMGSRRLLWDLSRGGNTYTAGLRLSDIDQVIEVGQVGRAFNATANQTQLFMHRQAGSAWGDTTALAAALDGAAALSADVSMNLSEASSANPGVPPSSLFSFLRAKPSIAGVVLTEFDTQYLNPYYHSSYDNGSFIQAEPITAAGVLLARTLHSLAAPVASTPLLVNATLVKAHVITLAACLVLDSPGMGCALASSLLNPDFQITDQYVSYAVKHYMGVLQYIHPNPQEPFYKKTIYRFLWNYMGNLSAIGSAGAECAFATDACPAGQECIGWKGGGSSRPTLMGTCRNTTVRYHPVLSTRLDYSPSTTSAIGLALTDAAEAWEASLGWPADPLWTESNWPTTTPLIRVLHRESSTTEWGIFFAGIGACGTTALLSWWGRARFEQHLKPA